MMEMNNEYKYTMDQFNNFINNADLSFVHFGEFGIVYKLELYPECKSPYISNDYNNKGKEINTLIIKVCVLETLSDVDIVNGDIEVMTTTDWKHEVNMQQEVYLKSTQKNLQSICPEILHHFQIEKNNILYNKIINTELQSHCHKKFIKYLSRNNYELDLGIIVMEYLHGYETLKYMIDKTTCNNLKQDYFCMATHIVYELAKEYNINHGDFHLENILINETIDDYFYHKKGRPLLIDFGLSTYIKNSPLISSKFIENLYYNEYDIFNQSLCSPIRHARINSKDKTVISKEKLLTWIITQPQLSRLDEFIELRNKMIIN